MNPQRPWRPDVIVEHVSAKRELEYPVGQQRHAGCAVDVGGSLEEEPVHADEAVAVHEHERKAHAQKRDTEMQVSTMPSTRMLIDSRDRAKPASSITKPTCCIQNTRNAASSTQNRVEGIHFGRRSISRMQRRHCQTRWPREAG